MHDELSLERIIPDQLNGRDPFDQVTLQLHLERYAFAIQNGQSGKVLDMACGSGYGAYQILQSEKYLHSQITAVDIAADAIEYGEKRYASPSINFICADAMHFTDQNGFDTIVSLETIEHLKNPRSFVKKLYELLRKDGILIISAPVTPSTDGNPHHLSDFSSSGFRKLFETSGFKILAQKLQVQPYSFARLLLSKNKRLAQTRQHIGRYYLQHPGIFFARIRSLLTDGFRNKYLTLALRKI